jgi:hypothetical protein
LQDGRFNGDEKTDASATVMLAALVRGTKALATLRQ